MAKAPVRRLTARRTASSRGMVGLRRVGRLRRCWLRVTADAAVVGDGCRRARWSRGGVVEFVFDEVGDDFGVGFGDELVALGDEVVLRAR